MVKIIISGICGRMGRRILALARDDEELDIICGLESSGHPDLGKVIDGVEVTADCDRIAGADCVIEFSSPQATIEHLPWAGRYGRPVVIGTTGFNPGELELISGYGSKIPIVFSPNMSVGVNLLFDLILKAGGLLGSYDVKVEEAHHIHKKDAPSGTAKRIVEILSARGFSIEDKDVFSLREDEIVGDHKVIFESDFDRIELVHHAKTRDIFAQGALLAGKWVLNRPSKIYSMKEVLSISQP